MRKKLILLFFSVFLFLTPTFVSASNLHPSSFSSTSLFAVFLIISALALAGILVFIFLFIQKKHAGVDSNDDIPYDHIAKCADVGIICYSGDKLVYINDAYCRIFGYSRQEAESLSSDFLGLLFPYDGERPILQAYAGLQSSAKVNFEYKAKAKKGSVLWLKADIAQSIVKGAPFYTISLTDITELKNSANEMQYWFDHDSLTGLYSKDKFFDVTHKMLVSNLNKKYIIIRLDIIRFKVYNDLYGIGAGDELLKRISSIFESIVCEQDPASTYARIEADHFAACLCSENLDYDKFIQESTLRFKKASKTFNIIPCFGIYEIDDPYLSVALMTDRARLALNSIRNNYNVSYKIFENSLRQSLINEQEIVGSMGRALENGEFEVYIQPQYNHTTGKLFGGETLVRWNYPERGLIPPNQFISIFEQNGFITKLDHYVWEQACIIYKKIVDSGCHGLPISVNISRVDIFDRDFFHTLCSLTEKYNIPRNMLRLEITESAYISDPDQLIRMVQRLQSFGFIIEMDDFGSGYSSLNTLKDVPVNIIKLDMKFLQLNSNSGRGSIILTSIIRMAHWLGLPIIAEGVETKKQADYLRSIGCDIVQGYLYSKPIPNADFIELAKTCNSDYEDPYRVFDLLKSDINSIPIEQREIMLKSISIPAGFFEFIDSKPYIREINENCLNMLGISQDDIDNSNLFEYVAEDDVERFAKAMHKARTTGNKSTITFKWLYGKHSESFAWMHAEISSIIDFELGNSYFVTFESCEAPETEISEKRLENVEPLYEKAVAGIIHFSVDSSHKILYFNEECARIHGYENKDEMQSIAETYDFSACRTTSEVIYRNELDLCVLSQSEMRHHGSIIRRDGAEIPITDILQYITLPDGMPVLQMTFSAIDSDDASTQLVRHISKALAQNSVTFSRDQSIRYNNIMMSMNSILFNFDVETGSLTYVFNSPIRRSHECSISDFSSLIKKVKLIHPNMYPRVQKMVDNLLSNNSHETVDFLSTIFDSKYRWTSAFAIAVSYRNQKVKCIVGQIVDIHEKKLKLISQQQKLKKRAEIDSMTMLLNKETMNTYCQRHLETEDNYPCLLVEIDIDDFKQINDRHGHMEGDIAIKHLSEALRKICRKTDLAGRMGGDEFAILFLNIGSHENATRKMRQLLEEIRRIEERVNLSVSIGGVWLTKPASFKDAFIVADKALYEAKRNGKGQFVLK